MSLKLEEVPGFETMTSTQLVALQSLPEKDLLDIQSLSVEDAKLVIKGLQEGATDHVATGWDVFLQVLSAIVAVAGVVTPVAGAVSAVLGVANTASALKAASVATAAKRQ